MFVEEGRSEREIATILNDEGALTDLGRPWTRGTVHQVLTNEKYIGNNVYNRISFKLKKKRVVNPPDMWIRADGAFAPIVEPTLFEAVRQIIQERSRRFTDRGDARTACDAAEAHGLAVRPRDRRTRRHAVEFGVPHAIRQPAARVPTRRLLARPRLRLHRNQSGASRDAPGVVAETIERDRAARRSSPHGSRLPTCLTVNDEFTASIVISRSFQHAGWRASLEDSPRHRPAARHHGRPPNGRGQPSSRRLLPAAAHRHRRRRSCGSGKRTDSLLDAYRFDSLDSFFYLAARTRVRMAA